jgi:hypothetical protein
MAAQERIDQFRPLVEREMSDPENTINFEVHPLPWSYFVTYHDGPCIQFTDANGKVCLPGFIYDPEVAATVLSAINKTTT